MKNLGNAKKTVLTALLALVIAAAAIALLWFATDRSPSYETLDTGYNPVTPGILPQPTEVISSNREEEADVSAQAEETVPPEPEESLTGETGTEESSSETESRSEEESTADPFAPCGETIRITGTYVNIRSEPNTNCEILGSANRGQTFACTGRNAENWFRIDYNGETAYISGDFAAVNS